MMRIRFLVVALLLSTIAFAQDKPLPPAASPTKPEKTQQRKSLPSISLPEYVIVGTDAISFSKHSKDELQLAHQEEFIARAGRGKRERWPGDPSLSRSPLALSELTGSAYNVLAKAAYGSFRTPHLEAWYSQVFERGDVTAHGFYQNSNGFVSRAGYTRYELDASAGSYFSKTDHPLIARSRIEGGAAYRFHSYNLYANTLPNQPANPVSERDYAEFSARAALIARNNAVLDYTANVFLNTAGVDEAIVPLGGTIADTTRTMSETVFGVNASSKHVLWNFPVRAEATLAFYSLTESAAVPHNPFFAAFKGQSSYIIAEPLRAEFGLSLYAYRGSNSAFSLRLYPSATLRYHFESDFTAFVAYLPEVRSASMRGYLRENPYTSLGAGVRHQDLPVRVQVGIEYDNRSTASGRTFVQYDYILDHPYFVKLAPPNARQWDVAYDGGTAITSLTTEGQVRLFTDGMLLASASFYASTMSRGNEAVPYLPDFAAKVTYTHRFPFNLIVTGLLHGLGQRRADRGTLKSVLLLGFDGEYWFLPNFGILASARNMFDREYQWWQDYDARSFFFSVGVMARF